MRTRERLIEVLQSVNPNAVSNADLNAVQIVLEELDEPTGDCPRLAALIDGNSSIHVASLVAEALVYINAEWQKFVR